MKIALLGYGKMGQAIEKALLAEPSGNEVVLRIGSDNRNTLTITALQEADVAVEFSTPESAIENIQLCFAANIPVVSGTTGWLEQLDEIKQKCVKEGQTFFYATNYSIGVALFLETTRKLAALMNNQEQYSVQIDETHHIHKLDKPSGTAITTAETILNELSEKSGWSLEESKTSNDIAIYSHRKNEVPGTHTVTFSSPIDTITLAHEAHSRDGFVQGAIAAAKWVRGKKGVYGMKDLLNLG